VVISWSVIATCSNVAINSEGAQQALTEGFSLTEIRLFIDRYDTDVGRLNLEEDAAANLAAAVNDLRGEIKAEAPKRSKIQSALKAAEAILEEASGGVIAAGLLEIISHIHP